jgi:hypothetical protein
MSSLLQPGAFDHDRLDVQVFARDVPGRIASSFSPQM